MVWTATTRKDHGRASGAYASDVTDREWDLIAPHLPAARPGGRPRSTSPRQVVDAIFYLLQTGCQWRMLPRDFPPRGTVYGYFRSWIDGGVWTHVHDVLYRRCCDLEGREEGPTAAITDSQSVKTGPDAREQVGFDAGKRIKGRKRHLMTDMLGLMSRVEVHSAGVQDRDGAAPEFRPRPVNGSGYVFTTIGAAISTVSNSLESCLHSRSQRHGEAWRKSGRS